MTILLEALANGWDSATVAFAGGANEDRTVDAADARTIRCMVYV